MFSLYGIRNIGRSLEAWKRELDIIYSLISNDKRKNFPNKFVQFLGYTIYNAKKYDSQKNKYALEHDIDLVRIPYWERDNINLNMILGDQYLYNPI